MGGRISFNQLFESARTHILGNHARLFGAQVQLSTGKRLQKPSDGAADTGRLFGIVRQQEKISRNQRSLATGMQQLQMGSSTVQDMSDMLHRARELAIQGANGTLRPDDRASIAAEIDQIVQGLVAASNVRFQDRYLFSGSRTDTAPFELITGGEGLQHVEYRGDEEEQQVEIAPGVRAPMNLPGSRLFSAGSSMTTVLRGTTGAMPGAGTDSGTGRDLLLVGHAATAYGSPSGAGGRDPATGLAPASGAAGSDTVLGTGHSVVITTDATGNGTISLNGGPQVAFSPTDTSLTVEDGQGGVIHVDVSGVAASLPPTTVAVRGDGWMSTDGGASRVTIDFASANQQVVDGETGAVLNIDSTGIRLAGEEEVQYQGSGTVFDVLLAMRDTLQDESLSGREVNTRIRGLADDLEDAHSRLLTALSDLGARQNRFASTEQRLLDLDVTLADFRSRIEDADLAEVATDLSRFEALYQASLATASRVNRLSLLDYI